MCSSYASKSWYVSCADRVTINGYSPSTYCTSTCASRTLSCTSSMSVTINPYSGTNSWASGQYSAGYQKWVKNAKSGSEVTSTTATKGTTLTYTNTTDGNNDMTTSVQAITPVSSSARINDSTPNPSDQTLSASAASTCSPGTYYQGYNATSCDGLKQSNTFSNSNKSTKTYKRYTLAPYNSSTMGYRPVIVVYKAN